MEKEAALEQIDQLIARLDGVREPITLKLPADSQRILSYLKNFETSLNRERASVEAGQGHVDIAKVSENLAPLEEYLKKEAPDPREAVALYNKAALILGVSYPIVPGISHPY